MNTIDVAAAALAQVQRGATDWDRLDNELKAQLRRQVRAVLSAVHEPDLEMAAAGAEIIRHVGSEESDAAYENDAINTWRFMMDAALSER